jgi:protein-S-isoprenylcysteine O-methyltransferase Ste14
MATLILLGLLIPKHMLRAWAQRRNRGTAIGMVIVSLLFVFSGYGLYYCGDEGLRWWISAVHSWAGILFPILLIGHILVGRKPVGNSNQ